MASTLSWPIQGRPEQLTERPDQTLHGPGMGDALTVQAALRHRELLVDGTDEVVDGQTEGSSTQHAQAEA